MAVINVPTSNTFAQWRQATNQLGIAVGDLTLLTTTEKLSLVAAINEVEFSVNNIDIGGYLATWGGSSSIVTVGSISTGTWNATAIASAKIATALTGKTYNALSLTANATGWTVGGGTTAVSVTFAGGAAYTLTGTNNTNITLPAATGTLALNNQTLYIGTTAIAINAVSGSIVSLAGLTSISATTFTGALSGNASTASSAAIWTTARTITIGNTGKSVNGSAAVTWSLAEIGSQTAGSTSAGFVAYNGTTDTGGQFYGGTTGPTDTTRLNYGGYFYPTLINLSSAADTSTVATHYMVETGSDGFVRPKTLANVKTELNVATTSTLVVSSLQASSITLNGEVISSISYPVTVLASPTTLVKSNHYVVTAVVTVTLPAGPAINTALMISNFSAGSVTVGRNGQNIMGLAEDMTIDLYNKSVTLKYVSASLGWIIV